MSTSSENLLARENQFKEELERIRQIENEEKQKLRAQINNEKKLTEEVLKNNFIFAIHFLLL
jgi:hypothetical protein